MVDMFIFLFSILVGLGCKIFRLQPVQTKSLVRAESPWQQAQHFLHPDGFAERVLLTALGPIKIQANGVVYQLDEPIDFTTPQEHVAWSTPDGIKVLLKIGCESLVFFAYIEPKYLLRTTLKTTKLQQKSGQPFSNSELLLAAGAPIKVETCQDSRCQVSFKESGYLEVESQEERDEKLRASGWADESALGYVYIPKNFKLSATENCYYLEKDSKMYDGQKGEVIFHNLQDRQVMGALADDNQMFSLRQDRIKVTGIIDPKKLLPTDCLTLGRGRGCGWGVTHVPRLKLPQGTPLFSAIKGQVVGVVAKEDRFLLRQQENGWSRVAVPSAWDELSFWVQTPQ